MIGVRIKGGIGDQLFQYATARALSLRLQTDLLYETSELGQNPNWLDQFNVVEEPKIVDVELDIVEESGDSFDEKILYAPDNSFLEGTFQFEEYFVDQADQIRKELVLKNPISTENSRWEKEIHATRVPISIHIPRRESENLSIEYFSRCVDFFRANFSEIVVYVFTNDIPFCVQNLRFLAPTKFIDSSKNLHEAIFLMSLCHHHVISDETSSWWGAWLDKREASLTFAPNESSTERIPARWMIMNF